MAKSIYTVKQVNSYIRNLFIQDYMLRRISVRGEVSNCKYHTSGHIYFSLKDESGTIACVMFAGQRRGLSFRLREGMQIVVSGHVDIYEKAGSYQLYAEEIRQDGDGALYERYQRLKQELEDMGMFAAEYKQAIPAYAKRIGVVTAPTGAAIRDIINISTRRNPFVQLLLYPAQVQGEGAKESIVQGIRVLDHANVDVIIVGRGGGSIEDLWAFNEEEVARAIFECQTPVISAVGHETDTTIADWVADLRAPTPSAAAELAVFDYQLFAEELSSYENALRQNMRIRLQMNRLKLKDYTNRIGYLHPKQILTKQQMRAAGYDDALRDLMERRRTRARHRLEIAMERLEGLSPIKKLNQGYSYVEDSERHNIKSIHQVKDGDLIRIYVTDGKMEAVVSKTLEEGEETNE